MRRSDYYISTSNWEGSSLSMIDAAYIGIPILCSDCPTGRKEFIGNNKRGYLYINDNDEDFIKQMYQMLNEEEHEIKKKLVQAKKETKKFTLFQYGLNFIKLIENI